MSKTRIIYQKPMMILMIVLLNAIIFADHATIDIQSGIRHLDNNSLCALPYYFLDIDTDARRIIIDSANFNDPIYFSEPVYGFAGNMPLSMDIGKKEKSEYKGLLQTAIEYPGTGKMIKVFPYESNLSGYVFYRQMDIFYHSIYGEKSKSSPVYDYMIICTAPYDTAFERLAKWKTRMGYRTRLFTVEHIDSISWGIDLQERLRNFIKSEHAANNFSFLLLAGDSTMIPVRKMFALECGAGFYNDEDSIPADMYYSALDGTFNVDNDNTYGEIEDSCDLYQDVYVGRMLFESTSHGPSPVINRTIAYESTAEVSHLGRGLFLGMVLWNPPYTPGGMSKEIIHNDIIPPDYHIKSFYEYQGHSGDADIIDSINTGYGIINHAGHGSYKGIWVDSMTAISTWDALGLTNGNKTGLFYSIGCWVGAFDRAIDLRNFSLCLQAAQNGGAVSIITNSRYGWGAPGHPGWGVSDIFDYYFFKLLFQSDDTRSGVLLSALKEKFAPYSVFENLYRWHLYQLNLFGDPSVIIHTDIPDSMHVEYSIRGDSVEIRITDVSGMPLPGARAALSGNEVFDAEYTDQSGYAVLGGSYTDSNFLCIAKKNYITYMDSFTLDTISTGKAVYPVLDNIYAGLSSVIPVINREPLSFDITVHSAFIDSSFTIGPSDTAYLPYKPFLIISDTITIARQMMTEIDTYVVKINTSPLHLDSITFSNCAFSMRVVNPSVYPAEQCSIELHSNTSSDTFIITELDSFVELQLPASPPPELPYARFIMDVYNSGYHTGSDTAYCANSNAVLDDDFSEGLINWPYHTSSWIIASGSLLHCGDGSNYFNNMDDTIISDSFILVPGSICSMDIDFQFPVLEIDSNGQFIYDVDGMFIKVINGNDTSTVDFISSGGALDKSLNYSGWMVYDTECDSPAYAKLMLHFISDREVTMPGVFIRRISFKPLYQFTSSDTGLSDERDYMIWRITPVISEGTLSYTINRVDETLIMNIYSIDGRLILSDVIDSEGERTYNIGDLSSGVYFVKFKGNGRIYSDKIILIR